VGGTIADQATVTGGFNPTGTVTFDLYNNPNGTGTPLFTDTESLSGGTATSKGFTTTATGTDYWVATYNGDSNNNPVTSGTTLEPVVITPATPSISTSQQPSTATVGGTIADQATVTGGFNPTGTVTFDLYNNPNGTGTPLFTDTEPLSGGVATSNSFTTTTSGTDYWVATYNGDANNAAVSSGTAAEPVVITPATPAISTSQQPSTATVGSTIADQATVTGGFNPTGTVTFNLYNNPNGTGTPLFTDTEPLSGGVAMSNSFTTISSGTDYWVATYNGDANNNPATSGTAVEPVVITPATPAINTTQQPATATVGTSIADQVTVTGGFNPTGTVTFDLYNNPNGTGTPLFTDTEPLSGGVATSKGFTTTATGTDYWVATYNGDANNNPATSGTAVEPVVITPATPAINTTQQPATATVGTSIADQATVTGGFNPTGTVTFDLYNNPNGTGTPLFTDTESLSGGVATSNSFTATATGTDYWVATYNGDSNNNPVTSGTALEPVVITPASPTITTTANPTTAALGQRLQDSAALVGYSPTGSITFSLYAPGADPSVGPATYTETVSGVNGNSVYDTSVGFVANAGGTWHWVATYSGDPNNNPVASGPRDEPVTVSTDADLQITKTDGKTEAVPGTRDTYTIVVTNAGPSSVTGAMVTDTFPAIFTGVTFTATATGGATGFTAGGSGNINDTVNMPVGSTITYLATGTISTSATGMLSNTATVTPPAGVTDPDPNNNTATDTDTLTPENDVGVTKTDNKGGSSSAPSIGTVVPGSSITYAIILFNSGPSTATNVAVSDPLPSEVTSFTWSGNGHSNVSGGISDTIASLAPGASVVYTVTATVDPSATGTLSNTVTISAANDTNPNNDSATDTDNLAPQNDVNVTKTDDQGGSSITGSTGTVVAGDSFTYTITVSNSGPSTATNISVNDLVPSGVTSFTWSGNGHSNVSGAISDTISGLAPDTSVVYTVTATVSPSATGEISNTVTVTAANDTNSTNNSATDTDNVEMQPDVTVSKVDNQGGSSISGSTGTVVSGNSFTYTITVSNTGVSTATNVSVSDPVPGGLTSFVWSGNGHSNVSGAISDTIASLTPGASVVYSVTATVSPSATGEISNTVTVTAANATKSINNSATDTDNVEVQPDVTVSKVDNRGGSSISGSTGTVVPGNSVTYTITVGNTGVSTATNVSVSDPVPAGLSSFVWSGNGHSNVSGAISDTIASLAPGASVTYTVTAAVDPSATGQITNTATVTANNVPAMASDTDNLTPQNDVSVTKSDNKGGSSITPSTGTVVPGTSFIYTITASNSGPSTATNVSVSDPVPGGLTSFVWSGNGHSNVSGAISDMIASLAPGASVVYTVTATVDPAAIGSLANTVTVSAANDANPNNNTATDTDTLTPEADLGVTKMVSNRTPNVGDTITFTVTLTNNGPSTATGVTVQDGLPSGLKLVSAMPSTGTYTGGIWTVGTVTTSVAPTLIVVAKVVSPKPETNTATIQHSDQFDPNTSNNQASVTVTPPIADIALSKTVSQSHVMFGMKVTYTFVIRNLGPNTASGVVVTDPFSSALVFVSASPPSQGTYNRARSIWNVGSLANGAVATLHVTFRVMAMGKIVNTAHASALEFDPALANNVSSAIVIGLNPATIISKRLFLASNL
jgi:uncharacterized repeat protein (TIGR01451 family)